MEDCFTAKSAPSPSGIFSSLLLLGTVHSDACGFRKALAFFTRHKPDLILTELSPFARRIRQKHQRAFHKDLLYNLKIAAAESGLPLREALKHPEIIAISRQLSLPFEYRAARAYARRTKAIVLLVDYSPFSRIWISSWSNLISSENLLILLRTAPRRSSTAHAYAIGQRRINGCGPSHLAARIDNLTHADPLWKKREYFMVRRIKLAIAALKPSRPVYIGGWWHLTQGEGTPTLRDILMVDSSRCQLLDHTCT